MEIDGLLRRLNITAIYVTHDQAEAMALGDRIVVMSQGQIEQIGSPRDIYYRPVSNFVADFIGSINTLPGSNKLCRPENVQLVRPDQATHAGTLAGSFFLGDRTRLILQGITEGEFIVETALREDLDIGSNVHIRIDETDLITPQDPA